MSVCSTLPNRVLTYNHAHLQTLQTPTLSTLVIDSKFTSLVFSSLVIMILYDVLRCFELAGRNNARPQSVHHN